MGKPVSHPSLAAAIEEQQTRVWRLRSLLDVLREGLGDDGHGNIDDIGGALDALIEYAGQIHLALDGGALKARAAELEEEARREAEWQARHRLDGGEQPPDDVPTETVQ